MKRLKILIVEDEVLIAELISDYLLEADFDVVGMAISFDEALALFDQHHPDLVLVDIRLYGERSGIDLANELLKRNEAVPIVYLSSQYDPKTLDHALQTHPYGYLTKPIQKQTLRTTIVAAYRLYLLKNPKPDYVELQEGKVLHRIAIQDILYIQADHVYIIIYTRQKSQITVRMTLGQIMQKISAPNFIQCHRSYLVNTAYIAQSTSGNLVLSNGHEIPVSRGKRKSLHFEK